MFSEILKIKPQLDNSDLNKMERTLNGRFRRIAKRFGRGIVAVFKGAGGLGLIMGFINKFLNPLKETQEAIDRLLKSSDDIATNAGAFETSTGKLFKLIQLAKGSGVEQDSLFNLLSKYQVGLGNVRNNEKDPLAPILGAYKDDKDLVDSFFGFIQDIKKLDKKDQASVKAAVFGAKNSLKIEDFLQLDFGKRVKETGLNTFTADQAGSALDRMAGLNDLKDALAVQRENKDLFKKAARINEDMVREQDKAAQLELDRENRRIESYKDIQAVSQHTARIMALVEEGILLMGKFLNFLQPALTRIIGYLEMFSKSRLVRGVKGIGDWFGKGE